MSEALKQAVEELNNEDTTAKNTHEKTETTEQTTETTKTTEQTKETTEQIKQTKQTTDKTELKTTKSQKPKKPDRKINKHERAFRTHLNAKLKTKILDEIDDVHVQIKKEVFQVDGLEVDKILIPNKEVYVVYGLIKPLDDTQAIVTDTNDMIKNLGLCADDLDDDNDNDCAPELVPTANTITNSDVEEVLRQIGKTVTKEQVEAVLKAKNGDIVEAIMALT